MHPVIATRPHPYSHQLGSPREPKPCRCLKDEPAGDLRTMTCIYCGHQVGGVPVPTRALSFSIGGTDHSQAAAKRPRYRGAQ